LYVGGVAESEPGICHLDRLANLGIVDEVERADDVWVGSVGGDLGGEL